MPKEEEDDDVSSVDIDGSEDEETKEEDEEAMNDLSNADIVRHRNRPEPQDLGARELPDHSRRR